MKELILLFTFLCFIHAYAEESCVCKISKDDNKQTCELKVKDKIVKKRSCPKRKNEQGTKLPK